jgi:4-hydroxy-tetrahydrodipicolinate synthase
MKHAATDLALVTEALTRLGPEFRIHVGLEELSFPMLAIGAAGMVNAVGNLLPRPVAHLYEAVRDGKLEEARRMNFELWDLNQSILFDTNPIPLKYTMKRLGILPRNDHRLPMLPASSDVERRCDQVLEKEGCWSNSAARGKEAGIAADA